VIALAQSVAKALKAKRALLVTAESCTGGWAAQVVTSVAGSSEWFERGFVTYSNDSKSELLGVKRETLERCGAVSEEAAREMALGALERSRGTLALAITGVAGPGGGSDEKPVGLVFLHAEGPDGDLALRFRFPGDRDAVRRRATVAALHLVRQLLSQNRHS
jgi:nicotinamide-nucleotide amidase